MASFNLRSFAHGGAASRGAYIAVLGWSLSGCATRPSSEPATNVPSPSQVTVVAPPTESPAAGAATNTGAPAPGMTAPSMAPGMAAKRDYAKPSDDVLKQRLTPMQYDVTQHEGTEPPFANEYWNNHEKGIYVDVVTGEPLFSSTDKFESGTGWPSFTAPIDSSHIVSKTDSTLGMDRTEVKSKSGKSHLGHVFNDGPAPTGLRYCIDSAALRFIPVSKLEAEGYGDYLKLFTSAPAASASAGQASAKP
jgi:methionine-R-sulfoxide reductase